MWPQEQVQNWDQEDHRQQQRAVQERKKEASRDDRVPKEELQGRDQEARGKDARDGWIPSIAERTGAGPPEHTIKVYGEVSGDTDDKEQAVLTAKELLRNEAIKDYSKKN